MDHHYTPDYKSHNVIVPQSTTPSTYSTSGWGNNELLLGLLLGRGILDRNTGAMDYTALNTQLTSIAQSLGTSNDAILAAINANAMQTCAASASVKDSVQTLAMTELAAISGVKDSVQTNTAFTNQSIAGLGAQVTRDTYAILDGINANQNNNQTNFATTNSNVNGGFAGVQASLCSGFAGVNAGLCNTNGIVRDTGYATDTNVNSNFATQNIGLLNNFNNIAMMATQNYNMLYNQGVVNNNAVMMKLCEISSDQKAGFVATEAKIDKSNDDQTIRAQAAYIQQLQNENNRAHNHNELNINSKNIASAVENSITATFDAKLAGLARSIDLLSHNVGIIVATNNRIGVGNS